MNCLLDKQLVDKMVREYGSPLYVFHEEEFIKTYNDLTDAIRKEYNKYSIGYSFKTNYTPYICSLVKDLGGFAEVVSDMEFNLARKVGFSCKQIIYNGPVKGNGLFIQLENGGTANIDSLDEMKEVVSYAKKNPNSIVRIAFRVNIDIGQGFISRFGLDAYESEQENEKSELAQVFLMADEVKNIEVVGLHCHIGRSRSIEAWENRVRIMLLLVDRFFKKPPEFIDLGSGMNSVMEPVLAAQFGEVIPDFNEYARVIGLAMTKKYGHLPESEKPILLTEPGTTLVSGCMSFLSSVKTIKKVKGKSFVTFNCSGGNMGDICHLKNLPISIFRYGNHARDLKDASFVGYTCLEHDHLYEGFEGKLAVGDIVQFRNVGSYSNVFKPPFILPNCAMVVLKADGRIKLIKRKETMDDIFQTYVF